ncbi:MAG: 3-keto-5-aminohexanoate cleavage protein [Gammaproteobacteria bacterium]|jgi:3-keto-5-aminohexanoate cleavage enzyme|nr:3-keto-5-aminohexanoate cleavage protein [Gammaproteobacteria bacterium]NDA15420.1 3-keto-5-aminohexanoate cleavage protein [Gammaproteobacteria bacterium]NDG45099.1 3-keto-5-aminohexanoate cleavage protein [Gammaproteobacteria bacterium]
MTTPIIVTTAITGSQPRKRDNPAVPVTPAEQIESTHEAFEAGSALVHIHVRDAEENPSSDPELFAKVQEGVIKHCPGMIIQFSTGGRGRAAEERGAMLYLQPDMASLATGSVNFPGMIYENPPQLIDALAADMQKYSVKPEIEVFDAAMLYHAVTLAEAGKIPSPLHVQFVMGIPGAMPVRRKLLEFLVDELKTLAPNASWCAMGIGRHQFEVNKWSLEMGGHARTGFEDNVKIGKDTLAPSNAALVKLIVDVASEYGRHAASPYEARDLLGLAH